jgi:hypothetical protein
MSNYDHLRTPSAYDDMIRPLLQALEAVKVNIAAVVGTLEAAELGYVRISIEEAITDLELAHGFDGDEPRT